MSTTTNMGLQIPEVGDEDYVTKIEESLESIDEHDHSTGKGVQISTGGIATGAVTAPKLGASAVTTVKILDGGVTTAKLADGAVTPAKKAALGQQVSASCGTYTGTVEADVTNLTVTITTTGRPVFLAIVGDGGAGLADFSKISMTAIFGSSGNAEIFFYRDSTQINQVQLALNAAVAASNDIVVSIPPSIFHIDTVAAGTYVYKIRATGFSEIRLYYCKLIAFEL